MLAENDNWTQAFFDAILKKIDSAYKDILGIDPKKNLRKATSIVKGITATVLPNLSTFTINLQAAITDDARREEILKELGFAEFYKKAQRKILPDLVQLLYQFKENMDAALITEITANKNVKVALITNITAVADSLKNQSVDKDALKTSTKIVTATGIVQLNDLYTITVKRFAQLAVNFYKKKGEKVKAEMFTFTKLKKTVDAPSSPKKDGVAPNTPTNTI